MKIVQIIYKDLLQFVREQKVLSIFLIITLAVMLFASSIISVCYLYLMDDMDTDVNEAKKFMLETKNSHDKEEVSDVIAYIIQRYGEKGEICVTGFDEDNAVWVGGIYNSSNYVTKQKELQNGELIVSEDIRYENGYKKGDNIFVGGKLFKIVGFEKNIFDGNELLCEIDDLLECEVTLEQIRFTFYEIPSEQDLKEINTELANKYSCNLVSLYDNFDEVISTLIMVGIIGCIFVYSLFFEILLLKAWHNINYKKYMMYRIVGCTQEKLLTIILAEEFIIGIIGAVIGNLFYLMSYRWRVKMELQQYNKAQLVVILVYFVIWISGCYLQARKVSKINLKEYNKWREL